ncbi:hypothetical protein [Streptomyces sp. WM6378]|uniref:hypothetical protein n=1 Tax=Streptomyces sp. WM6378 TaxID=1415557 RepID=UPI000B339F11|nr:hypothetical protein [Streptomyces sp. WM6378]
MAMTMRVYEMDRRTGQVVRQRALVAVGTAASSDAPMMSSAYPPCRCRRCVSEGKNE